MCRQRLTTRHTASTLPAYLIAAAGTSYTRPAELPSGNGSAVVPAAPLWNELLQDASPGLHTPRVTATDPDLRRLGMFELFSCGGNG